MTVLDHLLAAGLPRHVAERHHRPGRVQVAGAPTTTLRRPQPSLPASCCGLVGPEGREA